MAVRRVATQISWAILFIACSGSGSVRGADVRWQTDLKQAARDSQREQKPMLIEFTASWCHFCTKMKRTTFQDAEIVRHLNACFIPVSVDAGKHPDLMKAVGVAGLPTTVIVSPKLEIVKKITGYQSPAQMRKHLEGFCLPAKFERSVLPQPAKVTVKRMRSDVPVSAATSAVASPWAVRTPGFGGRCLVSMRDDRKAKRGKPEFSLEYRGTSLQFATAECKRRFHADPGKYWPANDGVCPVTQRESGVRTVGRPQSAAIYHSRLWFFASQEQRKKFAESPSKYAAVQTARQ